MKMIGLPLACGFYALFLASTAAAQQWRGLGPEGGDMVKVLADPAVAGRAYAVGSYGMSRTDDAGRNWLTVGAGLSQYGMGIPWAFAADGQVPGRLFFLDYSGRLMRSDDAALNWAPTGYSVPLTALGLGSYYPTRYTLTVVPGAGGGVLLTLTNGYIYKSTDLGVSFQSLSTQLPAGRAVRSLAVDPTNPQHLLAALGSVQPGTPNGVTLLRSSDGGANWTAVAGMPVVGEGVSVAFHGQQRVTAALNGQLYVSTDNGQSWQQRQIFTGEAVVAAAPTGPQRLILKDDLVCLSSSNDFVTSQTCNDGWPADGTRFSDLAAVRDGSGYRLLAAVSGHGALAYVPASNRWESGNHGLYGTPVRGLALQPGSAQRLFAGSGPPIARAEANQLFASSDGGQSWDGRLYGLARYLRNIVIDPTAASAPGTTVMYAAGSPLRISGQPTSSGVYKSSDGGVAWVALNNGFPPGSNGGVNVSLVRQVTLDPRSCAAPPTQGPCRQGPLNTVYAVTGGTSAGFTVYKSTQGGNAWQPASGGLPVQVEHAEGIDLPQPIDLEIDPLNGDLYLGSFAEGYDNDGYPRVPNMINGVFYSSDGGANWQHRVNGLPLMPGSAVTTQNVFAVAVHPRRAGQLWISTTPPSGGSRIYRSSDSGANWTPIGAQMTDCDVRDLQIDSAAPDVIYAAGVALGASAGCVYRSEDAGLTWNALHTGLPVAAVYDLRQDLSDRRRIVLGTNRGVWEGLLPSDKIFIDTAQ